MEIKSSVHKIREFNASEIASQAISMDEIIDGSLDGFIVNNFLNAAEIKSLIDGLRSINEPDLIHIEKDFDSYPMSFAQFDQLLERNLLTVQTYFEKSNQFISSFSKHFGVDVLSKLNQLFSHIKNAPNILIPRGKSESQQYIPITFRELFPGEGCLKAHCENLFFYEFPSFFTKINAFSTLENQLSFFMVLQKPSTGGELTLFDIEWNKHQKRLNDNEIKLQDDNVYAFDDETQLKRDYFSPDVGSLVVFSGGTIWHRVEKVISSPSRITLGGFLSFSHQKDKLYAWS